MCVNQHHRTAVNPYETTSSPVNIARITENHSSLFETIKGIAISPGVSFAFSHSSITLTVAR